MFGTFSKHRGQANPGEWRGKILREQANKRFWDICSLDVTWTIDKESETLPVVRFCNSFVATCSDVYCVFKITVCNLKLSSRKHCTCLSHDSLWQPACVWSLIASAPSC